MLHLRDAYALSQFYAVSPHLRGALFQAVPIVLFRLSLVPVLLPSGAVLLLVPCAVSVPLFACVRPRLFAIRALNLFAFPPFLSVVLHLRDAYAPLWLYDAALLALPRCASCLY